MDISPINSLPFKNVLHSGFDPLPNIPSDKSLDEYEDNEETGALEELDEAGSPEEKSESTPLEQYMAEVMSTLFAAADPRDDIFDKIRNMRDETVQRAQEKGNTPAAESGDRGERLFNLDISIRGVFERVERLIHHARKEDGGKVFEATAAVLKKQSASFDLDFSFTTRFLDQGVTLAKIDEELLSPFLDAVTGLADFTDESLQNFLTATENLFNGLEENFGLGEGELQGEEDLFKKQATRFLDAVREIVNSPFLLDEEGRQEALEVPSDDTFYRKKVADIFAEAGGMDAARRIVGGQPSDTEILLDSMKKSLEKMDEFEKAGKKSDKKKKNEPDAGETEPAADGAIGANAEDDEADFAKENFKAVTAGLFSANVFRASQFFQTVSDVGPSKDIGKIRDIAV